MAYLLLYVDDIILATSSDRLRERFISQLQTKFPMSDLDPLSYFLGIAVTPTPIDTKSKPSANARPPFWDPTLYCSLADALQYLTFTRPDVTYTVQQVCLFMHDSRESQYDALKRILRYIQGTIDHGLHLYPFASHRLITYTDADWGGCPYTRRSHCVIAASLGTTSFLGHLSVNIFCLNRLQESEYRGVANAVSEACWLHNLLLELHCPLRQTTIVYCDNVIAIYLSGNPIQHQRTKHVEMDIHFVQEKVVLRQVRVLHVPFRY
ncbi:uncharacterized protein LOC110697532 [Chenopodium quinoa]|uniref:uncharacterized protein LOC110697532 n=1 Tax=Chenopodium quinoa TaxID=63459 RepID=UPI000B777927|nr:uncharacterized protein LOC110697532 [Chenopodium quinoa]